MKDILTKRTPFPLNLGGSALILDKVQPMWAIRDSAQINGNSASISSHKHIVHYSTTEFVAYSFNLVIE